MDDGQPGSVGRFITALKGWAAPFADPLYLLFLALGFTAWLLPEPGLAIPWPSLLVVAAVEEIIFRGLVQGLFSRALPGLTLLPGLTIANLATSVIFALLHLFSHPPLWALAVLFPSLIFGWSKDRFQSLIPCCILHFIYNLLYFSRP